MNGTAQHQPLQRQLPHAAPLRWRLTHNLTRQDATLRAARLTLRVCSPANEQDSARGSAVYILQPYSPRLSSHQRVIETGLFASPTGLTRRADKLVPSRRPVSQHAGLVRYLYRLLRNSELKLPPPRFPGVSGKTMSRVGSRAEMTTATTEALGGGDSMFLNPPVVVCYLRPPPPCSLGVELGRRPAAPCRSAGSCPTQQS